jgi:alpha-D-ribose 1-methylphosphonate 5-triphosphate synthase subunit PhnH
MMSAMAAALEGGLSDPVPETQAVFRALMAAFASPGRIERLTHSARPPAPLSRTAAAVALTLVDHDTPVWLDPPLLQAEAVVTWLGFHCGAVLTGTPAEAAFAFVSRPGASIAIENFSQGSQDYPDRSATLILQVDSFETGTPLVLQGPGIPQEARIAPEPMPRHFVEQWRQNQARFPRGVDIILAGPGAVVCLPRTLRVKAEERREPCM